MLNVQFSFGDVPYCIPPLILVVDSLVAKTVSSWLYQKLVALHAREVTPLLTGFQGRGRERGKHWDSTPPQKFSIYDVIIASTAMFSVVQSFWTDYGLLLELHTLTLGIIIIGLINILQLDPMILDLLLCPEFHQNLQNPSGCTDIHMHPLHIFTSPQEKTLYEIQILGSQKGFISFELTTWLQHARECTRGL